jgi:hypothetical protein
VTLTRAGDLFADGRVSTSVSACFSSGNCVFSYGLYVDGQPVAGTLGKVGFPANSGQGYQNLAIAGTVHGLAAGPHTVDLRETSSSGSFGVFSVDSDDVTGIALG